MPSLASNPASKAGGSKCDFEFKILLVGDSGVGKSTLFLRFARNVFDPSCWATIGVDFQSRVLSIDNKVVRVGIVDTAGAERFQSITVGYYRGMSGALLVYDISDRSSYDHATRWLENLRYHGDADTRIILVGNKSDLGHRRRITFNEAKAFAAENNLLFIETSARDSSNVEPAFQTLLNEIYQTVSGKSLKRPPSPIQQPEAFYPPISMGQSIRDSLTNGNLIDAKIFAYSRRDRETGRVHTPKALFVNTHVLASSCSYFRSTFDLSDGIETGMTAELPQGFATALDLEEDDLDGDYDSDEEGPDGERVPSKVPTQTPQERTVKAYLVKYTAYRTLRAIIWYIYSGEIFFTPAGSPETPIASAKSIYQFAEEHGMDHLGSLAFGIIAPPIYEMEESALMQSAFTPFASRYPQIRDIYVQRLRNFLAHGPNEAFQERLSRYFAGELPGSRELFTSLLQAVTVGPVVRKPLAAGEDHNTVPRVPLPWPTATKNALRTSLDHGTFEDTRVTVSIGPGEAEQPMHLAGAVDEQLCSSISQLCQSGFISQLDPETAPSTLRAIVFHMYTGRIKFKPLGPQTTERAPYPGPSDPEFQGHRCSPREVLYVARKLNTCDGLVDLAANEIISQLTPENVVEEIFWNPPAPTQIINRGVEIIQENRENVQIHSQLQRMLEEAASGDSSANTAAFFVCFTELLRGGDTP